jgi:uncharacterized membrane protein (UPF0127 family)
VHFLEPLLDGSLSSPKLFVDGHESPLATTVEAAFDSASRNKGLLGRDHLAEGTALVIAPCSAIHTFAMRFPIDVAFARRDGHIIKLRHRLSARRISASFRAFAVVEMAAGALERSHIHVGDRLVIR